MAKKVMTVKGPVAPESLGLTSMHDHIMFDGSVLGRRLHDELKPHNFPIKFDDKIALDNVGILQKNTILALDAMMQDDEDVMLEEVRLFKRAGGDTILEVSVPGCRYDAAPIGRIAEQVDVNIILSTGFDAEDSWPDELRGLGIKGYRDYMLNEIKNGVDDTGLIPGHLKICMESFSEGEEHALRAIAQVCNETNLALTIHPPTDVGGNQLRVIDILKEEGVNLERVVLCHTPMVDKPPFAHVIRHPGDYKVNTTLARRILDAGCNISKEFLSVMGLELCGRYDEGDWGPMAGFVSLINDGYCKQMVTGSDVCGNIMLHQKGGEGFCRMLYYTLPMLRDMAGVSDYAIRQIFYENPARILAY